MLMFANQCIQTTVRDLSAQDSYRDAIRTAMLISSDSRMKKMFTLAPPKNAQNDCLYAPAAMKKRDVTAERLIRATFCQSLMVSVGVSKLGCTHLIFVDPGVKINGHYRGREVFLSQQLLPAVRQVSS